MKAIVIGATGATGRPLVELLLADPIYTGVTVITRRKAFDEHPKLKQVIVDFSQLEEVANQIQGDVAYSCLGTTLKIAGSKEAQRVIDHDYQLKFAQICYRNVVPTFVLLSSSNADSTSSIFYSKMKGELEDAVKKLGFKKLQIIQPGALIRPNTDRFGEQVGVKILNILNRFGIGNQYKPLEVEKLAKVMIQLQAQKKQQLSIINLDEIFQIINK